MIDDLIPDEVFQRIFNRMPYDSDLKTYSKMDVSIVIKSLERDEEYEKCHFLWNWYKKRYNHEENYIII